MPFWVDADQYAYTHYLMAIGIVCFWMKMKRKKKKTGWNVSMFIRNRSLSMVMKVKLFRKWPFEIHFALCLYLICFHFIRLQAKACMLLIEFSKTKIHSIYWGTFFFFFFQSGFHSIQSISQFYRFQCVTCSLEMYLPKTNKISVTWCKYDRYIYI